MTMPMLSAVLSDYEINYRGVGNKGFIRQRGDTNVSVVALSAPGNKPADLGQFPEQPDVSENLDIRKIVSSLDPMEGIYYDEVRITPTYMEFKDASEGMIFHRTLKIQNIGTVPAYALKIKTLEKNVMLSPGLTVVRNVTYSFRRPVLRHATIPIIINDHLIDYHVICSLSTEYIEAEPVSIDFGIVDIGCSSGTKIITISNIGGKSTRFTIDLGKNDMEVNVKPHHGIVRPSSSVKIHVEIIGITEGTHYSEFWIKSNPNIRILMKVNVIVPRLVIYYPNTTGDFTLVDFPPTFLKTKRYDTFVLRNISSQSSSFVVLGEIENELVPVKEIDSNIHPAYSVFKISPVEGRLEPFEGTIFHIEFAPCRTDANKKSTYLNTYEDFMAFLRILRVHCREAEDVNRPEIVSEPSADFPRRQKVQIQEDAKSNSTEEEENSIASSNQWTSAETVRLCIHGETEAAQLRFVPDELHLDNFESCSTAYRVLQIENPSKFTPVIYRFASNGTVRCQPSEDILQPGKSRQVMVQIGRKQILYVEPKIKLAFDVIAKTYSFHKTRRMMDVRVATFNVICHVKCGYMKSTFPKKFITERNEGEGKSSPEWNLKKQRTDKRFSNKLYGRGKMQGNPIFTGKGSSPVEKNLSLALVGPEIARKKKQTEYWSDYLRTMQRCRENKAEAERIKNMIEGCKEFDDILYHDHQTMPEIEKDGNFFNADKICNKKIMKLSSVDGKTLIPLSPLQIYNVKISPTRFSFGTVVVKSVNFQELYVENRNDFSVMLKLISLSSKNIRFPTGDTMILQPGSSVRKLIEFRADEIGKFNSYIDYVINDNHSFELTITADVVYKFLSIGVRELVLGASMDYVKEECYRPLTGYVEVKNKLNARTNFKWDVPASASYIIEPLEGSVRGKRNLFVSFSYEPNSAKTLNTEVIIVTKGGSYMTLKLNTLLTVQPQVYFIHDNLDTGEIPLNLPYTAVGIIQNDDYNQVLFEIDETSLAHGWQVYPKKGHVPPRGIATIQIVLRFEVCLNFNITVRIIIQKSRNISLRIIGRVSFPMLKIEPEKILMKRISVDASQTHLITATNFGKTMVTLNFPLREYPEFRVSLSESAVTDNHEDSEEEVAMIIPPGTMKSFYLHFAPVDLATYHFYLPMIINEILGPVTMDNPRSTRPQEYLSLNEGRYLKCTNVNIVKPPQTPIPTILIDCTVAGHVISFSKLVFDFDVSTNKLQDILRVLNNTMEEQSFIIRIDELSDKDCPFTIRWDNRGIRTEFKGLSTILCTLKEGQDTYLLIEFHSKDRHGEFLAEAPIFVRGELDGRMFNRLTLRGKNPKSCMETDIREIYFRPIPLKVEAEENFKIWSSYFSKKTSIEVIIENPERSVGRFRKDLLSVTFPNGNIFHAARSKRRSQSIEVSLKFRASSPISFRTRLHLFGRESGVDLFITVFATSDNCLMTIHAYSMSSGNATAGEAYEFQRSSSPSIDSETLDNCSLGGQESAGNHRQLIEGNPTISTHSDVSYSSWSVAKILRGLIRIQRPTLEKSKSPDEQVEEEEELEIKSHLGTSTFSIVSHSRLNKSRRDSRLNCLLFPTHGKNGLYESHMQRTLKVAEQWLYSSPLRYQFYPHIVDGITAAFSNHCNTKTIRSNEKSKKNVHRSYVDVLLAIVGPEIYDCIGNPSAVPSNNVERVVFVLKMYENMLNFLLAQGAFLCHVSARYLLSYSDYEMIPDESKLLNSSSQNSKLETGSLASDYVPAHIFDARSKQCWLDVILQTYKTLVLKRVTPDRLRTQLYDSIEVKSTDATGSGNRVSSWIPLSDTSIMRIECRARSKKSYSPEESLLLAWLEHHYEQQRRQNWFTDKDVMLNPHEAKDNLQERNIKNFTEDLADGLVLIAVTVAHCPFLINDFFKNVYVRPRSPEEALHNSIAVVTAWQKIRLGFVIAPRDIVRPSSIQMLMLVVHLFQTLPTYRPKTKIKFSCPLTEKITRSLNFVNSADTSVSYVLQFFGNHSEFFDVQTDKVFEVDARKTVTIKIQYHARKIHNTCAYLVLCGGAIGPTFAKNQCFILTGEASHLRTTDVYNIKSKLYQVLDKTLSIRVPYKYAAEYDIWIADHPPTTSGVIRMERWSETRWRKVPRRLFLNQNSLVVISDANKADLSITIACIAQNTRHFWLIFQSKLGDFIIQIISKSQPSITDHLIVKWARENCICPDPSTNIIDTCPLNITFAIPSRNHQLWNCVSQMFQKSLNSRERIFWSRHLETNIGQRLIYSLMGDHTDFTAQEFAHIFNSSVTYNVSTLNKPSHLIVTDNFIIPDVQSPGEEDIKMKVHIDELTPQVYETTVSLVSLDKREKRQYTIDFLCAVPPRPRKISG